MKNIFEVNNMDSVYSIIDSVRSETDSQGFSIIRGAVSLNDVEKYKARVNNLFSKNQEIRISGSYQRGSTDFQRLDLGEYGASTRFARYYMFFPWNNDEVFSEINSHQINIFNLLSKKDSSFGSQSAADPNPRRFRMSFVLQYPIGGGFMSRHREFHGEEEGDKAYVVYLALTTRGEDFETGGAYVERDGKAVDIEQHIRKSDLVVYRGDMYHGVAGIDRHKPVQLGTPNGRMILTSIIKYFDK